MARKPAQFDDWPEALHPGWEYRVVSDGNYDGDTVYCFADLGLDKYAYESWRLEGLDTPEINRGPDFVKAWGFATRDFTASIFPAGTKALGTTVKDASSFGRYRVALKLENGAVVNDLVVAWMMAQEWWPEYVAYKGW